MTLPNNLNPLDFASDLDVGVFVQANTNPLAPPVEPAEQSVIHYPIPQEQRKPVSLPPIPSTTVWGIDYSMVNMSQTIDILDRMIQRRIPTYAITANLNYAMLCDRDPKLADFTHRCPLVLCDGTPVFVRSLMDQRKLPERVAGADLVYQLAQRMAEKRYRLFLMGGNDGVAAKAAQKLVQKYPGLQIAGIEVPPFRTLFPEEKKMLIQRINASRADVLMIALGQPKGEHWIDENLPDLKVPLSIQLGASFDFIAGTAVRAPKFFQKTGLEWLWRTLQDPKRLGPRYLSNGFYMLRMIRRELLEATK